MNRLSRVKITDIPSAYALYQHKDMLYSEPCRRRYGIFFCKGQCIFTHNGKEMIADPNKAILIPKGSNYTLFEAKGGTIYCFNFDCQLPEPITEFISLEVDYPDKYIKRVIRIQELNLLENKELSLMKYVYEILEMLVNEYNHKKYPLTPLISYIEKHYSDKELTNDKLATECGYTEAYMRQLFKKQFNTSPKQYILNIRLHNASRMLLETNKKITEISSDCGFSSLVHFSRIFKEKFGESPVEYRINHRIIQY